MLHLTATDWVCLGGFAAVFVGILTWVGVGDWRAQRAWDRRRNGLPTPQDHAAKAARHAADTAAARYRAHALVAGVERAYDEVLRVERAARKLI